MPCYYCGVRLVRRNGRTARTRADHASVEHLIPVASGGSDHPENLRDSCARCNSLVGDWPLEQKIRFRALARNLGGWPGLVARFGAPRRGRKRRFELYLDRMDPPDDPESERVRKLLPPVIEPEVMPVALPAPAEEDPPPGPAEQTRVGPVLVDSGPWLRATGKQLRDTTKGPWWFEIDGHCWLAGGARKKYLYAVRRAAARAVQLRADRVIVMPPPGLEDPGAEAGRAG